MGQAVTGSAVSDIRTRQGGRLVKPSERSRGTTRLQESLIEAETVAASEVVAGAREASPTIR